MRLWFDIQKIYYINITWRIILNLYNKLQLCLDREGILNIPGIKYIPNGSIRDNKKLKIVSFIKCICVFTYIAQNIDK